MKIPKPNAHSPWKYEGNPHVLFMKHGQTDGYRVEEADGGFRIHIRDNDLQGDASKIPRGTEQWFTNVRLRTIQTKAGNVQFILDILNEVGEERQLHLHEVQQELNQFPNDEFTI